ncbi:MAG: hypothetical protein J6B89_01845 [Bacilli bacterium]|nr:hypothetical protein [Bacilli bacterium]
MQEYSVDDFLQSVHIKPVLAMGYQFDDDESYIDFLHNLCSLEKVSPLFLHLNSDISKVLIDYISDKRFATNNVDVINATNEFLCLYNSISYNLTRFSSSSFSSYTKLRGEFFTRFNADSYFDNNYNFMKFKPSFIQIIKSYFDDDFISNIYKNEINDSYVKIVDMASRELFDLEIADMYIVGILLQENNLEKSDLLCRSLKLCKIDTRMIISSVNYVLSKCPDLILTNINGNYDFISYVINNLCIDDINIEKLRKELVERLTNGLDSYNFNQKVFKL